jgi:hypothetical protein
MRADANLCFQHAFESLAHDWLAIVNQPKSEADLQGPAPLCTRGSGWAVSHR